MKSWQRYAGLAFLAVSALVIQQSVWVLRLFDHGQPGSGFMPFGLGVILAILAVCLIATNRGSDEKQLPFWEPKAWLHPLLAIIITVVYVVVFDDIGAITSVVVPGSGGSDAITKLVGGHVDFGGGHPSEVLPHIKAGRLRALAVAFEQRDTSIPDVPTFREAGYDVVTAGSVKGVAVPKGTPKDVTAYLEKKFKDVAGDPEFQKIMKDIGQPVMYQGADEYKVWFKQAYDQFGSLYKSLGIETK